MATIRPFKGIRPRADLAEKIAALPYDVYSRDEAAQKVKGDNLTFLRIDRPETFFPMEQDMYAKEVYEKGAEELKKMRTAGEFIQDTTPCMYVYEMTYQGRTQTGLVCTSSVDDYLRGVIRRHENTRREKELDRINHVDILNAQTGPIFLAYKSNEGVKKILDRVKEKAPLYDFVSQGQVRNRVFIIDDIGDIGALTEEFQKIPNTYIADGHHRAASAVAVSKKRREENPQYNGEEEFNFFLSVLFDSHELKIMDYNRVIKDLKGLDEKEFLEKIREKFILESKASIPPTLEKKGEMGLFFGNIWYKLLTREEFKKNDPVEALDVAYLQREFLDPILGIRDPSTDKTIDFVGGIRGTKELEERCRRDCPAAFYMYPTDINELFAVADKGLLMPPKSTWFEPKLLSGLFIHEL